MLAGPLVIDSQCMVQPPDTSMVVDSCMSHRERIIQIGSLAPSRGHLGGETKTGQGFLLT